MNDKLHKAFQLNAEIIMLLNNIAKKITDADSDAENMSYHFMYSDENLFNAFLVFNHVWMNYAIHKGVLTIDNVHKKMSAFRKAVTDTYGIDTVELSKKIMKDIDGTESTENSIEE